MEFADILAFAASTWDYIQFPALGFVVGYALPRPKWLKNLLSGSE